MDRRKARRMAWAEAVSALRSASEGDLPTTDEPYTDADDEQLRLIMLGLADEIEARYCKPRPSSGRKGRE